MTVKFVRRFQGGGGANFTGSSGWMGTIGEIVQQSGGTGTTSAKEQIGPNAESSETNVKTQLAGVALKSGLDIIDAGTDIWASKVWEKQAKAKAAEERGVQEELAKSQNIRSRAAAIAKQYDGFSGLGSLALSSAASLSGLGVYKQQGTDYSRFTKSIGQGVGQIATITADGVQAQGAPGTLENRRAGDTFTLSANQNSANYSKAAGIQDARALAAKQGAKLIKRHHFIK